ncbi:hypothetical protein JW711_04000 [Candidatus Woesearchaeota archaeon]|nr:hypothetical protein [Candidatus Woesearchaeota archaeon]
MVKRGGFVLFSGSRRAMSPLIATVLLIAFAVAMGAMIMNWSVSLGEAAMGPDCSGINLVLNPVICYSDNFIKVQIKNEGKQIDGLTVQISDDISNKDVALKNSNLRKGDTLSKDIPHIKGSPIYVSIVPALNYQGERVECDDPSLEVSDLPDCAN